MFELRKATIGVLLLAAAAYAGAQTASSSGSSRVYRDGNGWVEEITGSLPAARMVRVNTQVGSVRVVGGTQQTVTYVIRKRVYHGTEESARREMQRFTVTATRQGDTALFEGDFEGGNHRGSVDFNINTPRGVELVRIDTSGGGIGVNNIAGRLELHTMGGGIELDQIGGAANAHTMGGGINVGYIGGEARLETAGGGIRIENAGARLFAITAGGSLNIGTVSGPAEVKTAGGSINVRQTAGELRAETAGGSINVGEVNGTAVLRTAGGSIRLASANGSVVAETSGGGTVQLMKVHGGVHAENAGGGITVELVGDRIQDTRLQTSAGDIVLYLPERAACTLRAEAEIAGSPGIQSEFSAFKVSSDDNGGYGPKSWSAIGNLNGGGPRVDLSTSVGRIEIRKSR